MDQIIQCYVECDGCHCAQIFPLRIRSQFFESEAGEKHLGFKRVYVYTSFGAYTPSLCPICQNKLDRLDHLRIAIQRHVCRSGPAPTASCLIDTFVDNRKFYTESEVNKEAWKLIEKGVLQVDDKGVLTLVQK